MPQALFSGNPGLRSKVINQAWHQIISHKKTTRVLCFAIPHFRECSWEIIMPKHHQQQKKKKKKLKTLNSGNNRNSSEVQWKEILVSELYYIHRVDLISIISGSQKSPWKVSTIIKYV